MAPVLMKKLVKELLPPIVLKLAKKKLTATNEYGSYAEALKHADGYEDKVLTKVIVAKGLLFAKNIQVSKELDFYCMRTFAGLAASLDEKKTLTVIDFGGAAGAHYFMAKLLLKDTVKLDWRVIETPSMVNEARRQGLENDELHFFSELNAATKKGQIDLVFASGSVQYTSDPYTFLKELCAINAKSFMLTRTPITEKPCIILQYSKLSENGIGAIPKALHIKDRSISYPVTMLDRAKVEAILANFGELVLKVSEEKSAYSSKLDTYDNWCYIIKKP